LLLGVAPARGRPEMICWPSAPAWSPWLLIPVEFSRPLALDAVPPEGVTVRLQASSEECRALAARFGLVELTGLSGEIRVEPVGSNPTFLVTGRLAADAVQACVVTLEPVPAKVEAEFDRLFSRDLPAESDGEVEIDAEAETPEPLVEGRLDLGEILAQELSLALDPYPRAPDADRHLAKFGGEPSGGGTRSPFGVLAGLRRH
jgi:uncharacterized metal-binding protein YceD (DUF177 family)